jgi:hypothetical protein
MDAGPIGGASLDTRKISDNGPAIRAGIKLKGWPMSEDDPIDDEWIDKVLAGDPLLIEEEEEEPIGPPLSDSELDAGQRLLIEWQSPQNFSDKALCSRCKSAAYFNQPQLKYLHDA